MARPRNCTPSYLKHSSGRARAVWTDELGHRHFQMLPGEYNSQESRAAFARLQLEQVVTPTPAPSGTGISVNEVLLAFLRHAEGHYRRLDGTTTNEFEEYKTVARYLRELYGDTPAANFGPLALKALRQKFIDAQWCRGFINQRIGRVRRMFKWATSEELVPATVYQSLATVTGLQKGRSAARETEDVKPVPDSIIDATLPFLNRHVRGLVEFQRLTGSRPGEACVLRMCEVDTSGAVWLYRPQQHKNTWRGKSRTIPIGPKAQALLQTFILGDPTAYVFSPARAVAELRAERSASRQTPRYASHMKRNATKRKSTPKRAAAQKYTRGSYGVAIDRACDRAFPPPEPLSQRKGESSAAWWQRLTPGERDEVRVWRKAHRWHPNRVRHTVATMVRQMRGGGVEVAQALLGHARLNTTEIYAEKNEKLAVQIAAEIG